jgi:hypothetical protein
MSEDLARDWKPLLDAVTCGLERCEVALRIVLPFFRERITLAEIDELELTVRLPKMLPRKIANPARFYKVQF